MIASTTGGSGTPDGIDSASAVRMPISPIGANTRIRSSAARWSFGITSARTGGSHSQAGLGEPAHFFLRAASSARRFWCSASKPELDGS